MVHLLGRKRQPPVPSTLHLPLRSKAEYLRALDASSISKALSAVVAELDQYRRAGEPLPDNVVGAWLFKRLRCRRLRSLCLLMADWLSWCTAFAKERMKAFSTAKKKEARKRAALAAAAVAVLEPPPPRAPRAVASKATPPPRAAPPPPPEPRRSVAEAERLAPAGSVSSDDADEARAEALAEVSAAAFALEAAEAAAADDEDDVDALADELAAEALLAADEEEADDDDAAAAAAT
jgi:hypothetical protein